MAALDRRRFLQLAATGALGLGSARFAACAGDGTAVRHFEVPARFANPTVPGHLLRRPLHPHDFPPVSGPQYDVVVVGGGVSGLTAAWKLRRAGLERILLLELADRVGGTSIHGFANGTPFPWGGHYINTPPPEADCIHEILLDLGVIERYDSRGWPVIADGHQLRWPRERLFHDESWIEGLDPLVGASAAEIETVRAFEDDMLRWSLYRDDGGRPAFGMPLRYSSADERVRELDTISLRDYALSRGWRARQLDWLLDYASRDDYGSRADQVSAWAGIHYFACRLYDYRVADRYPADTLTWPEGNGYLTQGLAQGLGADQFRTNVLAARIWSESGSRRLGLIDLVSGRHSTIASRAIVYAGKLHAVPRVVVDLPAPQRASLAGLEYSPWLVAAVQVSRLPADSPVGLAWDNVLFDSPSTGYVVANHQQSPAPDAPSVLVYYLPFVDDVVTARRALLERPPGHWADLVMSDLTRAHPDLEESVEAIEIYRWGHGMVRPRPGLIWGKGSGLRGAPCDGLFFAGCDLTGLPLFEEACFAGLLAAEGAMRHIGAEFETSLRGLAGA